MKSLPVETLGVAEEASPAPNTIPLETIGVASVYHPPTDITFGTGIFQASFPEDRYEWRGLLGTGGMGEVWRVYDRLLDRTVAMKLLRREISASGVAMKLFADEALATARLQHPGIIPVLDAGQYQDGRWYFTMKEVKGRNLAELIYSAHREPDPAPAIRRLLDAFTRVCAAVAYAHAGGLLHRDLKPANIMIGDYLEVLVLDWGLARALAGDREANWRAGTPGFMAPEVLDGSDIREPTIDIFALGAILHEILVGRPAFGERSIEEKEASIRRGGVRPHAPPAYADLCDLVASSLAPDPADRPPSVTTMQREIEAWLEGAHQRERAMLEVQEARRILWEMQESRQQFRRLRNEARMLLDPIPMWGSVEQKKAGWLLEDQAALLEEELGQQEVAVIGVLGAALSRVPDLPEAHSCLANLYKANAEDAEERGDRAAVARFHALVRSHDRGQYQAWLDGTGRLTLHTNPPDAHATAFRYTLQDRRLVPVFFADLGPCPLREVALPPGSWMIQLSAPGYATVRYPVVIGRAEHWHGIPPDGTTPAVVQLPKECRPEECYVPAGWFLCGDPNAQNGLARRRIWLDGFMIRRTPVTHADYLQFLNDELANGRESEAETHQPFYTDGLTRFPLYGRTTDGQFQLVPDAQGDVIDPEWPVYQVHWRNALAWCRWYATKTGLPWRLPFELEREKAARGVDGRIYPWGDQFEPTWSCNGQARKGRALPVAVQAWPADEGPYGMLGAAGNVRDLCLDEYAGSGPPVSESGRFLAEIPSEESSTPRVARGGGWSAGAIYGRSGVRIPAPPDFRHVVFGFRPVRSFP